MGATRTDRPAAIPIGAVRKPTPIGRAPTREGRRNRARRVLGPGARMAHTVRRAVRTGRTPRPTALLTAARAPDSVPLPERPPTTVPVPRRTATARRSTEYSDYSRYIDQRQKRRRKSPLAIVDVAGDSGGHRRGRVLLPEPSLVRSHRERRQAHGRPGGDPGHHARGRHGFPAAGQPLGHRRHRRHRGRRRQVQRHRQRRSHQRREARSSRRATSSRSRTGQTRPRRSSPPRRKCPSRAWRTRTTGTGRCTSTFPA